MATRVDESAARDLRMLFGLGAAGGLGDAELLRHVHSGDDGRARLALDALVRRHGPLVLAACRAVLGDGHDAEDAFQATFLVLARKARSLWARDSIAPWLHQVAVREARSARAAAARRLRHERRAAERTPERVEGGAARDVDDGAIHEELARLPAAFRRALVLCDLEGLRIEQAARALRCPAGTVKSRLARGRRLLRARLARRGLAPCLGLARAPAVVPEALLDAAARGTTAATRAGSVPAPWTIGWRGAVTEMIPHKWTLGAAGLLAAGSLTVGAILGRGPGDRAVDPFSGPGSRPPSAAIAAAGPASPPPAPDLPRAEPTVDVAPGDWDEPGAGTLEGLILPRPWETSVRIRYVQPGSVGFGSGTIVRSATPDEAILLTTAHQLADSGGRKVEPEILVDLFDGRLLRTDRRPGRVTFRGETYSGERVDADFARDLALIRIRPGRRLPASPVRGADWRVAEGQRLVAVGCSEGRDATAWSTTVREPLVRGLSGWPVYEGMACTTAPKQGRSGGGLFDSEGYLCGVCNYAQPRDDLGLYATPRAITTFLARNGLATDDRPAPPPAPVVESPEVRPEAAPGTSRRLEQIERRLEALERQSRGASGAVAP